MCGLGGFSLSPDEVVDARVLAQHLLIGIEPRGTHATGAAFFENGEAFVQKAPVTARKFVDTLDMSAEVRVAILHTRFGTHGSAQVNENNHPIDVHGLIGVHNGVIWNDDEIFDRIGREKRIAEVDSEAIFALLHHGNEKPTQALTRIDGSASVAWIVPDGDPEMLHAARVSMSPLVYAHTEAGSFVFASTSDALRRAMGFAGMSIAGGPYALEEGVYLKVRRGEVLVRSRFAAGKRSLADLTHEEKQALDLA